MPHARRASRRAFTLVEIIIALTIIVVIIAAAIPSLKGLKNEQLAREPVAELVRLAKEARLRAMKEKRPYQIAFYSTGFTASRYLSPYLQLAQLKEFLASAEQAALEPEAPEETAMPADPANPSSTINESRQNIVTKSATALDFKDWMEDYKLPEGTAYAIKYWHDIEPLPVEGEIVKLWVFQPSGICQPITVRLERATASFEVQFSALTADITREKSELR
jgi:prepilin-type N-terminal cleavage/methylation domain-containing protein